MGEIGGENSQGEDARHETAQRRQRGMRTAVVISGKQHERLYIYPRSANKPLFLGKVFLYQRGDYIDGGVDFIVVLPQGLEYDRYKLEALVNFYKLAGKRWTIETK